MDVFDVVLVMFTNLFRTFIIYRFVKLFYKCCRVGKKIEIAVYVFFYVFTAAIFFLFQYPLYNIISNIVGLIGIVGIYEGKWRKKITIVVFLYVINMMCDAAAAFLFDSYIIGDSSSQVFSIITNLLIVICQVITQKLVQEKGREDIVPPHWLGLTLVPIVSIFLVHQLLRANLPSRYLLVTVSMGILMINMLVFYLYNMLADVYQQLKEKRDLEEQMRVYAHELEVKSQSEGKIRLLKHDMKHHLNELAVMAKKGEAERLVDYLDKMDQFLENPKEHVYSGNKEIDGILNYMIENARTVLCQVEVAVQIPERMIAHSFELNVILGNLLENAIEAAKKAEEKKMAVKIHAVKGMLYIDISNSYDGNLKLQRGRFQTTKEEIENHGIGLSSVEAIVNELNGVMDIYMENQTFRVMVMLYLDRLTGGGGIDGTNGLPESMWR